MTEIFVEQDKFFFKLVVSVIRRAVVETLLGIRNGLIEFVSFSGQCIGVNLL